MKKLYINVKTQTHFVESNNQKFLISWKFPKTRGIQPKIIFWGGNKVMHTKVKDILQKLILQSYLPV